jgi:hypothetical protein
MIGTLARKELNQHWHAFTLLMLVTFAGMGLVALGAQHRGAAGSLFEGLRAILMTLIPLAAMVLGHRLVAVEFRQKTQLFLEALPIPRWRLVAVKYLFGLAVIFLLAGGALAIGAAFARRSEFLTPRFLAILAARSAAWTWCVYSVLFLFGFLGRYRFALGVAILVGCMAVHSFTDVRFNEWGPFALIDGRFAFENTVFPAEALRITTLLALILTALSFLLALAREGSVAALLGEKMSHREKMFCTGLVIAVMALIGSAQERRKKDPYDLPGAVEEARGSVVVKVARAGESKHRREAALAARTADELAALRDYLGADQLPPVFIVGGLDLDSDQYERVKLEDEDGVLVRANLAAPNFTERKFFAWLVSEVLEARSFGRAKLERSKWVLDGFAAFWEARPEAGEPSPDHAELVDAAHRGMALGFNSADLGRWLSFEQRVGANDARAVAWLGLDTLARRHGSEACRGFVRAVLGRPVPHDARATWHDLRDPIPRRLERAAGVSLETFIDEWREDRPLSDR